MLNIYEITADGQTYYTCETEHSFDGNIYRGSSNLYCQTSDREFRPYVIGGTNYLYLPYSGTSGLTRYYEITDVELVSRSSFDFLPVAAICFLFFLAYSTMRRIFRR